MQDNKYTFQQKKQEETNQDYLKILQEENHRLRLENAELKKNIEKEEFLHKNLYKQWTELNARTLIKNRELRRIELRRKFLVNFFKYSFYALLLGLIVFVFYFFSKEDKNLASSQTLSDITDTTSLSTLQPRQQDSSVKNIKQKNKDAAPPQLKQMPDNKPSETATREASKNFSKYRVRTKTFFYNHPEEGTRRNTFLLPYKDSYGIITPMDDQNGFIYIIYVNHAGRTSKGWIRKIDLDPVN